MISTSKITTAALTDPGRVRDNNEDAVAACPEPGLLVLADGMGGHNAGEIASTVAIRTITESIRAAFDDGRLTAKLPGRKAAAMLKRAVEHAHEEIYSLSQSQPDYQGMGTTIVAALLHDDQISIAHAGDSRLYVLRNGKLRQITRDHSLAEELVRGGHCTREQADAQINNNAITRALGVGAQVEIEITQTTAEVGDTILMCSDGLYNAVADEEIGQIISSFSENLDGASRVLVDRANEAGGEDNISVILARVDTLPSRSKSWHARLICWLDGFRN